MKMKTLLCVVSLTLIGLIGCTAFDPVSTNEFNAKDGSAGEIARELNDMGKVVMENELLGMNNGTFVQRDIEQDTNIVDIKIVRWKYDESCKAWIRSAELICKNGKITRYDTVWFYDTNNELIIIPTIENISHYQHTRSVYATDNTNEYNNRFVMDVVIEKNSEDTVFVFNGTITGDYNGDVFDKTVITNVKRKLITEFITRLSYPYEGTISIDRPLRTALIEFGGEQTAKVTVTRKSDGKTWVFIINIQTGKELS